MNSQWKQSPLLDLRLDLSDGGPGAGVVRVGPGQDPDGDVGIALAVGAAQVFVHENVGLLDGEPDRLELGLDKVRAL